MLSNVIKTSYYLVLLSILLIPAGYLFRVSISSQVSILLIEAILGIQSLLAIYLAIKRPEIIRKKLVVAVFIFCIAGVVSLIANAGRFTLSELLISSLYIVRFVIFAQLIIVGYFFSPSQRATLLKALVISGIVFSVTGLVQYFFYPDLRNVRYLGWDEHLYRLTGTFFDPNFAGGFLSMMFFLIVFLRSKIASKVMWISTLSVIFIALILTYSRSAYLSFVTGMAVIALLKKKSGMILIGMLALACALVIIPKNFGGEGVNLMRTASISARIVEYEKTIKLIQKAPLFGHGFNTLRYVKQKEGLLENIDAYNSHSAAGVPNSILFILATSGLVGLGAFIVMGRSFMIAAKGFDQDAFHGIITISAVLLTHSMFENTLFYPFILLFLSMYFVSSNIDDVFTPSH